MENKTGFIGLFPNPEETFTLTAQEYMGILALKKQMLHQVAILEKLEQKFYTEGKVQYYTPDDIVDIDGKKSIRTDFWKK